MITRIRQDFARWLALAVFPAFTLSGPATANHGATSGGRMSDLELEVPDFIVTEQARRWAEGILAQVRRDQAKIVELSGTIARHQPPKFVCRWCGEWNE